MFGYWLDGTLFFGFLLASLADLRTKEVPDYLSGFLIVLGLVLPLLSFHQNGSFIDLMVSYGLGGFAFLFGYLMFRASQWGGGDTKLITGSALLISQMKRGLFFFLSFIVNLFLIGSVIGIVYLVILTFQKRRKLFKKLKEDKGEFFLFIIGSIILSVLPILLGFSFRINVLFWILAGLFLLIKPVQILESLSLRGERKVENLVEGDWVIEEVEKGGEVLYSPDEGPCITEEEIEKLKEKGVKKVEVKRGLPLVPSFFFSFLLTKFYQNLLFDLLLMV